MSSVFVISEIEPFSPNSGLLYKTDPGKYLWMKPASDGSIEFYESTGTSWEKVSTIPASASLNHSHEGLNQLPDVITLLSDGVTGSKTIGGYKFTFNHGVLVGFEAV